MSKTAALKLSDNPSKINDQRPQLKASHRDEPKTSMCMSNMAALKVAGDVQSDDSRTGTDLVGNDDEQRLIEGVFRTSTCPTHNKHPNPNE